MAFIGHKPNGHKIVINHKNEIKTDNRIENLEICSTRYNTIYSSKHSAELKGITKTKSNKFQVHIFINGKLKHLGTYSTLIEANEIYKNAYKIEEIKHYENIKVLY